MRPYNLPTDQLALYRTSAHGRALARGDDRVAVCIDCHGVHHILRHEDPGSTVFPSTIPKTCGRCHSDAGLMRPRGHDGNPFEEYAAGVHGQALLEHGDSSAPDCARCHGAHGAAPPGVGDVDKVCGQCHAATRAQFLESPHRRVMAAAGLPECASCHGNHRVGRADIALLDTVCLKCHDAKSTAVNLATRMKALHTGASEELERARRTVQRASEVPIYVEDYRARLEEARTSLIESLPAMHSLDLARVEQLTHRARSLGAEVESEVGGKLGEMKWRRVGLGVFWLYLLVTVAILARFRTRAARRESA
jgi:hypothetical protein